MANRYWVGGTANWDGTAGTKWALTSGGTGGQSVPTSADDVFFDNASGANTVTISTGNTGAKSINCTGFTGTLAGSAAITVSGSVTLDAGMTFTSTSAFTINGTGTITSAGKTFGQLIVSGSGITVTLGDALTLSFTLVLTLGTFDAASYNVTCLRFVSANSNTRTLKMGSGLWTITGSDIGAIYAWDVSTSTNFTLDSGTANLLFSNTTTSARGFYSPNGSVYNKLTIGGATGTSTFTFNGNMTFSELASTKTVAHTILVSPITVGTWSITGTAGNVVTVRTNQATFDSSRTITKSGGGFLTGIDYLDIRSVNGFPVSDTWYIGPNSVINTTAPNRSRGFFTTQRANNAVIVLQDTTGSGTWTVPTDWNNGNNSIHIIGGGGGGGTASVSGNNRAGGGGGGGGGYTKLTNQSLTISSSIAYQAGAGGAAGVSGGTTSWNSGASTAGGGGGGSSTTTPTSTGGTAGTGSTFNGGAGGVGSTSTAASTGNGGGGGGGAGGLNGAGGNGGNGFASTTAGNVSGGGGGGNGGGTNGANGASGVGGVGGNNSSGVGGGSNGGGSVGGGGGGSISSFAQRVNGGSGIEIFGAGSGGGMGGGTTGSLATTIDAGFLGGGGGGGGVLTGGTTAASGPGVNGGIIITYVPLSGTGNMFFMFS
jgi:hypothetical protein